VDPLPFAASFDALAFIVRGVRTGGARPECAELVPVLSVCLNSCAWDPATKRITQSIPFEHYRLGWHPLEDLADAVEVRVLGRRVFIQPATLERLAGKRLVLKAVSTARSKEAGVEEQVLVAVPLDAGSQPRGAGG
jgi:hypothetical protein